MKAALGWTKLSPVGALQWERLAPSRAGRAALGVVLPLAIGWMIGHVDYGAYMALGALPSGFASFQGETRSRVVAVALASVGMTVSTFVGATTAAIAPWLLVPIIALWGYVTGLSISLGQLFSVGVLQWSIALLIAVGLPASPAEAALRGGLVLAGGLLQALLVALTWTVRAGSSERTALAASYSSLATYASSLAAGKLTPPPSTAFAAGGPLADPNPLLPRGLRLAYRDLLEEAERIRASLAALAAHAADQQPGEVEKIDAFMGEAAGALNLITQVIGNTPSERAKLAGELSKQVDRLAIDANATWRWSGETLLGQLRSVAAIITDIGGQTRVASGTTRAENTSTGNEGVAWALGTLRANITTTTEAGRHALRLAAVAALAEALVQAFGIYQGRWATLTIFLNS